MTDTTHTTSAAPVVPDSTRDKWRDILNTVSRILNIPVTIVTRVRQDALEAYALSTSNDLALHEGMSWPRHSGMYCDYVLDTDDVLLVPNALSDPVWKDNPDVQLGLVAYLGVPITWPDGEHFGTFCILDTAERRFTEDEQNLVRVISKAINDDLKSLYAQHQLNAANARAAEAKGRYRLEDTIYKTLFTDAQDAIILHEMNGNIIAGNPAAESILGYTEDELVQLHARDIAAPEFEQRAETRLKQLAEFGKALFQTVLKNKAGEEIPAEVSTKVLEFEHEQIIFSIVRPLSSRILTEKRLDESEHRLNEAERLAHIGNWMWDIQTGNLEWSDETFRIMGFEPRSFEPRVEDFTAHLHPEDKTRIWETIESAVKNRTPLNMTGRIVQDSGNVLVFKSLAELKCDEKGVPLKMFGTFQDISIRFALETEVLESRDKFRTLVENLGDRFVVFQESLDGTLLYISPGARTVFNLEPESMVGGSFSDLIEWLPDGIERSERYAHQLTETGFIESYEEEFLHPDGSVRTLNTNAHLVHDASGKPIRVDGISEDITERKMAEYAVTLNEKRLSEAQRVAAIGTWDWDLVNDTVYWTPLLYSLLSVDESVIPSYDFYTGLVHEDDRAKVREDAERSIRDCTTFDSVHRLITPNGRELVIHLLASVDVDDAGTATRMYGTLMDITERVHMQEDLRESRDRFKNLVEDLGDSFVAFQYDLNGKIQYISPAAETVLGQPADVLIGKNIASAVNWTPETRDIMPQKIPSILQIERVNGFEDSFSMPDGTIRTISVNAHLVKDERGKPQCIEGVFEDVTERKIAEAALRKSEAQLREAQRVAKIGSWTFRVSDEHLEMNEGVAAICGLDANNRDILYEEFMTMIPVSERKALVTLMADAMMDKKPKSMVHRFIRPDGETRWVQAKAIPVLNKSNQVAEFFGTMVDITEHYLMERELKDSRDRYRRLVEDLGDRHVVFQHEPDGTLTYVSPSCEAIFGLAPEEVLGKKFGELLEWNADDLQHVLETMHTILQGGPSKPTEARFKHPDGEWRVLSSYAHIATAPDGGVIIEGIGEDITDRKKLENELRTSHDRYKHLVEDMGETFTVYRHTIDGKFLYVSPGAESVFGIPAEECIGKQLRTIIDWTKETRLTMIKSIRKYKRGERIYSVEGQYHDSIGNLRTLSNTAHPVFDDAGKMLYIEGIVEDITDRKKAETALHESERQLREAQRIANIGNWVYHIDTNALQFSDEMYNIYGAEPGTDLSTLEKCIPYVHPGDVERMMHTIEDALSDKKPYRIDHRVLRPSGEVRYVSVNGEILTDDNGTPVYIIGTMQDITDSHILQQELQESHDRFKGMVEDMGDDFVVYRHDTSGIVHYVSPGALTVFEIDPQDAIGKSYLDIVNWTEKTRAEFLYNMETLLVRDRLRNAEYSFYTSRGEIRYINVSSHSVNDTSGNLQFVEGVIEDITHRYLLQQELQESHDRFKGMVEDLGDNFLVYRHNLDGVLSYASPGMFTIFGVEPDNAIGRTYLEIIHWNDETLETFPGAVAHIVQHGKTPPGGVELVFFGEDGRERTVNVNSHLIRNDAGEPDAIEGIVEDITERKRAEQALIESEHNLKEAQRIAQMGNFTYEIATDTLYYSDGLFRLLGYEPGEFTPSIEFYKSLVHPEDLEQLTESFAEDVTVGLPFEREHRIIRKDGEIRFIRALGEAVFDEHGKPERLHGVVQDITEAKRAENAVLESQRLLRHAQSIAHLGNWQYEFATKKLTLSEEMYHILSLDPDTDLGDPQRLLSLLHRDDQEGNLNTVIEALNSSGMYTTQHRIAHADGEIRYVNVNAEIVRNAEGHPVRLLGTMQDITEISLAEQELRESRERFDLAVLATKEGIFDVDYVHNTVYFSPQWKRQLGYTDDELPNQFSTWTERIHPEDHKRVVNYLELAKASNVKHFDIEYRMIHKSGRDVDIYSRATILRDEDGSVRRIVGTHQDVSDKKALEDTLKVYKQFADSSSQAFGMAHPDTTIAYVNQTLARLLGADSPDEIIGKSFLEFYPQELKDFMRSELVTTLVREGTWSGELSLQALDGTTTPTIENYFLIRDEKGEPLFISDAITPIGEIKEKEEALERARAAAELANKAKSEFLANMSHEIRTPMNAIVGMSHLALNTVMTPKQRDYVLKIDNAAKLLLGILNDILDFSKIEAGKLELEKKPFELEQLAGQSIDLVRAPANEKNIDLIVRFDPALPRVVLGDALRIGQVINNLLQNAVKFTPAGSISLSLREQSREGHVSLIEFTVTDTGIGISKDQRDRLFSVFTQADGSITRKYGGTGLGLSISKQLVEMMDGNIGVYSKPGEGSTFSFAIPLEMDTSFEHQRLLPAMDPQYKGTSVLVIDDHLETRDSLQELLESMNFAVQSQDLETNENSPTIIDIAREYDIVLIDSKKVCTSGKPILLELADYDTTELRIVLLESGPLRNSTINDARQAGFSAVLEKPVMPTQLHATVRRLLSSSPESIQPPQLVITKRKQLRNAHVLIVEDNDVNQQVAIELLTQSGLSVSAVWNGKEALDLIRREKFDLVLMDVQMPVMDGLTATKCIREIEGCTENELPIIAMTAYAMAGDAERCISAGMNGYLPKPIDPGELHAALQQWLPKSATPAHVLEKGTNRDESVAPWVRVLEEHGIEASDALKVIHGNEAFFNKMLLKIVDEYSDAPAQIRTWMQERRHSDAHMLAHSIKSISGYIGAKDLWNKTVEFETAIKEKQDDWHPPFEAFEKAIQTTTDIIRIALSVTQQ